MNGIFSLQATLALAAGNSDKLANLSGRFQNGGGTVSMTQLVLVGIGVLIVGCVLWLVARKFALRDGRSYHNQTRLFHDLCRLHGLDFPSRKLLWRLAKLKQLEHPAQLFVEPSWFEAPQVPGSLQPFRSQLAELKLRIFQGQTRAASGL